MKLLKYLFQYRFSQMGDLISNDKREPEDCRESIKGKTVVLTGATSGIGLEAAGYFAERGARLILINRNREKSEALEKEIAKKFDSPVQTIIADFSSLDQVRQCAAVLGEMEKGPDVIIHNTGVFHTGKHITRDNIEEVFQVNHLGAFMLNYLLREKLKRENKVRIIYVNSEGHRFALAGVHLNDLFWKRHIYTGLKSYGAAKTAQLLTMMKFKEYFSGSRVTINAMHPGNVKSNMGENNGKLYRLMKRKMIMPTAKDPLQSARALYYLAASIEVKDVSGRFFNLTTEEEPAPHARDAAVAEDVWNKSLELCGLS